MHYTLYQLIWMFLLYAFLGWCMEVVFQATRHGRFINRGFLNGPVCPIYGFGVVLIAVLLMPLSEHLWALFFGGVILTSALEFVTGFVLEKLFDDKWRDYSNEPFNLMGYICLRFSLAWGVICVVVVDRIHPPIVRLINWIPQPLGTILLVVFSAALLADCVVTISAACRLRRRLRTLEEIGRLLHRVGDRIGEPMADGAIHLYEKLPSKEELQQKRRKKGQDLSEESAESLAAQRQKLSVEIGWRERRLLHAFPRLQNGKYRDSVAQIRQQWRARREAKRSRRTK